MCVQEIPLESNNPFKCVFNISSILPLAPKITSIFSIGLNILFKKWSNLILNKLYLSQNSLTTFIMRRRYSWRQF